MENLNGENLNQCKFFGTFDMTDVVSQMPERFIYREGKQTRTDVLRNDPKYCPREGSPSGGGSRQE